MTTSIADNVDSIRKHLDHSQWWPPDVMRRHQWSLLAPLIEHARLTVPWYRQRLSDERLDPQRADLELLWKSLPLLTRFDIQAAGESLHSTAVPAIHGRIAQRWTSGSTAAPVAVLATELTGRMWIAHTLREYVWQRYDVGGKLASIRSTPRGQAEPPAGAHSPDWGLAARGRIATGPAVLLDARSTTDQQYAWLMREQPNLLQTYPSIAAELAKRFLETNERLPGLGAVYTFGEILEPKYREICQRAWNVPVLDSYSTTEVGYVATECVEGGQYHVHAEHLLVEILDDLGRECGAGETGRVVITDLYNYAMPLVRYEIGDYAEVAGECACGRKLPTLRRILGRQRNMLALPNGEMRWPVWDVDVLDSFEGELPIRQFQVVQHGGHQIEVKLVVARPLVAPEETALRAALAKWLGASFEFRFSYVDSIARGPTGKFEDFRRETL